MRRFLCVVATILALYLAGYAAARWRKVLVLHEASVKEQGVTVHWIGAGRDVRDDWRGSLKNAISTPAAILYAPLGWAEVQILRRLGVPLICRLDLAAGLLPSGPWPAPHL